MPSLSHVSRHSPPEKFPLPTPDIRCVYDCRQISHDPSSPLPMHDWTDNDDQMVTSSAEDNVPNRPLTPFRRMHSIDSVDSKSSSNQSTQYSSSAESAGLWVRPTISRLNSRTSGLSFTGVSIREEDEAEDQLGELKGGHSLPDKEQSDEENEPKLNDDIFGDVKPVCSHR